MTKPLNNRIAVAALIVIFILFVTFIIQNAAVVTIHFLFWSFGISRSVMIIILLLIGVCLGWLGANYTNYRRQKHHSAKKHS